MMSCCSALLLLMIVSRLGARSLTVDGNAATGTDGDEFSLLSPPLISNSLMFDAIGGDEERRDILLLPEMKLRGRGNRRNIQTFARNSRMERRDADMLLRCMIGRVYRPCWND